MTLFSNFIFNLILSTFPIMLYLFYTAYKNTLDDRENYLAEIVMIYSILYLNLRCSMPLIESLPMIMVNISIVLSYVKKNKAGIFGTSLIVCLYTYLFYEGYLFIIVLEYFIYYFIYVMLFKKIGISYFILIFSSVKLLFMILILIFREVSSFDIYVGALLLGFSFCLCMLLIIYLMDKAENVLKMHKSVKESISDREVRSSLFRITHEIKNPIAVCKGYLDMFDVNNKEHARKYIPIMREEINKTLLLLDDFLSLNKLKLNKDILDINLLLEDVLNNYWLLLKERRIKLIKDTIEDEVYVYGDYNRLTQVFVNIIKNSVEAMSNGGVISICSLIKGKKIVISFKDNGSGMSGEVLKKIKEPFFTTKKNGNGLGVSLSYEIIEGHNGKIEYESKLNEYTLVSIVLPIITV